MYSFRLHAVQKMFERNISPDHVIDAVENGEVIRRYDDDTPYPSRLILGWVEVRPLHVVAADTDTEIIIITAYEPDPDTWNADFWDQERAIRMKCMICKHGKTLPGTTTVTLERGATTLIFKGVPAQICQNCGEAYLDEETSRQLLAIAERAVEGGVQVEIREYSAA